MSDLIEDENDQPDEDLVKVVSYLDGELDDDAMRKMERRLAGDADVRNHADLLSRTWAMLDELNDDVTGGHEFTRQTMATVLVEAGNVQPTTLSLRWKALVSALAEYKALPFFAAGILGGAIGLLASEQHLTARRTRNRDDVTQVVLDNFALLQNTDLYSAVPDADSLKRLSFVADVADDAEGQK